MIDPDQLHLHAGVSLIFQSANLYLPGLRERKVYGAAFNKELAVLQSAMELRLLVY